MFSGLLAKVAKKVAKVTCTAAVKVTCSKLLATSTVNHLPKEIIYSVGRI